MSKNMKGIIKGLKYFTHIFDIEEEEEEEKIEIGLPTDVKHVAHIGWDGPAASSPSWMNDFKASPAPESSSATIQVDGLANDVNRVAQDSTRKKTQSRDIQSPQKNSRRKSSMESTGSTESPHGSPTQKSRANNRRRQSKSKESSGESSNNPPNLPKKTRRKKSKDSDGSVKSKSKENGPRHGSRQGLGDGM